MSRKKDRSSFVGKEVRRKGRKIIGTGVRVSLTSGTIEFQHHNGPAPGLRGRATGDVEDGTIDRRGALKRGRRVPEMERESKIFAVQSLGKDYTFRETIWEKHL